MGFVIKHLWSVRPVGIQLLLIVSPYLRFQETSRYTEPVELTCGGLSVRMVPLLLYTDDTSGNCSEKWNKVDCWCFLLSRLLHHINSQLQNIHFIVCSNRVDMADAIAHDLRKRERWWRWLLWSCESLGEQCQSVVPNLYGRYMCGLMANTCTC